MFSASTASAVPTFSRPALRPLRRSKGVESKPTVRTAGTRVSRAVLSLARLLLRAPRLPRRFVVPKGHARKISTDRVCNAHPPPLVPPAPRRTPRERHGRRGKVPYRSLRPRRHGPGAPPTPNPDPPEPRGPDRPTHHTTNHESARQKSPRKTRRRIPRPGPRLGRRSAERPLFAEKSLFFKPRNPAPQRRYIPAPRLYRCSALFLALFRSPDPPPSLFPRSRRTSRSTSPRRVLRSPCTTAPRIRRTTP